MTAPPLSRLIQLNTRGYNQTNHSYYYLDQTLDLNHTAMVIIDPWQYCINDPSWSIDTNYNVVNYLNPAANALRSGGVQIIIASYDDSTGGGVDSNITLSPHDKIWTGVYGGVHPTPKELEVYLDSMGITNLIYAGYATNLCLVNRPVGVDTIAKTGKYNIIVVRDCTVPHNLPGTDSYNNTIRDVEEYNGTTTTLNDIWRALDYTPSIPVAEFRSNLTTGMAPDTVEFTDQSTGKVTRWEWNFGDGTNNTTSQNPTHTYMNPGSYTVSLWAIGEDGSNGLTKISYINIM